MRMAGGRLITAAENLDAGAALAGAASLREAAPHVARGVEGFRSLLPSAFSGRLRVPVLT